MHCVCGENPEGEHIFARNYDLTETNYRLLKTSPKDGYKSISMVDLTIIDCKAPTDLMNKMKLLLPSTILTESTKRVWALPLWWSRTSPPIRTPEAPHHHKPCSQADAG